MNQEEKQLLLKDLCAGLPYGICANLPNHHLVSHKYYIHECNVKNGWTTGILNCAGREECYSAEIEDIQPYLRPMSSMTEEEKEELLNHVVGGECVEYFHIAYDGSIDGNQEAEQDLYNLNLHWLNFGPLTTASYIDWLNKKMFDFRGLIPKGLAIEVKEDNNPYIID